MLPYVRADEPIARVPKVASEREDFLGTRHSLLSKIYFSF
jgi:hypothetical protein